MSDITVWISNYRDVDAGEDVEVSVTAFNAGSNTGTVDVTLEVGDLGTDSREIFVGAGDETNVVRRTLTVSTTVGDGGSYAPAITSVSNGEIADFADSDGLVDVDGFRDALDDWRDETLPTAALREALSGWRAVETRDVIRVLEGAIYSIDTVEQEPDGGEFTVGDVVTWEYDVENGGGGDDSGNLTIRLSSDTLSMVAYDGLDKSFSIEPGNSDSIFVSKILTENDLDNSDSGEIGYSATVSPPSALIPPPQGDFEIEPAPEPNLRLSVNGTNNPAAGSTARIKVGVENDTDRDISDNILIEVGGQIRDQQSVSLEPQGDADVELSFSVSEDDVGELDFTLTGDADPAVRTGTLEVGGTPEYEIVDVEFDDEVNPGEFVEFVVEFANNGSSDDAVQYALDWQSTDTDEDRANPIQVDAGDSKTTEFGYLVKEGDEDSTVEFTISTQDDQFSGSVDVGEIEESLFDVDIQDVDRPADEGETASLLVSVSAPGIVDEAEVALEVDATVVDDKTVDFAGISRETVKLEWDETLGEATEDTIGALVTVEDATNGEDIQGDFATTLFEITPRTILEFDDVDAPAELDLGDEGEWSLDVENVGSRGGTRTVTLDLLRSRSETTVPLEVDAGNTESLSIFATPQPDDLGTAIWRLSTDDDATAGSIDVADPGVRIEDVFIDDDEPDEGDTVTVTVNSLAPLPERLRTTLRVDGKQVDRRTQSIATTREVISELEWQAQGGDAGERDLEIEIEGRGIDRRQRDSQTETVDVQPDTFFTIDADDQDVFPDLTQDVEVNITNEGALDGTETVSLHLIGAGDTSTQDEVDLELDSGETQTVNLEADIPADPGGLVLGSIHTDDDSSLITLSIKDELRIRTGSTGWAAVLDISDEDSVDVINLTDQIQDVDFEPGLLQAPRVEITVPADDRYDELLEAGERIGMRVWRDGQRVPIDEWLDVRRSASDNTDTLIGKGARELRDYQERVKLPDAPAPVAVRGILEDTDLKVVVDDFDAEQTADVPLLEIDSEDGFDQSLKEPEPGDDEKWERNEDGRPTLKQAAWFAPVKDLAHDGEEITGDEFHNGEAIKFESRSASSFLNLQGSVDVEQMVDRLQFAFRAEISELPPDDDPDADPERAHPGFTMRFGVDREEIPPDSIIPGQRWFSQPFDDVNAGSFFEIVFDQPSEVSDDGSIAIDAILLWDESVFGFSADDDGVEDEVLQGVDLFPGPEADVWVETRDVTSVRQIESVRASQQTDVSPDDKEIGISRNRGASFEDTAGDEIEVDLDAGEDVNEVVRTRHLLVGKEGDGDEDTPQGRNEPMTLESVSVEADVVDTPVIFDLEKRGTLESILQELADQTDALWEIRWDPDGDRQLIEWTWPGQRDPTEVDGVVDVDASKETDEAYQRIVVFGTARDIDETFIAPEPGEEVRLDEGWIVPGSETVRDSDGERLARGPDYEIDYNRDRGRLRKTQDSRLAEGEEYEIEYQSQIRAEFTATDYQDVDEDDIDSEELDNLEATSVEAAGQAALVAAEALADPQQEAQVVLSDLDPTASLLGALAADELPFDPDDVRNVDVEPDTVTIDVGNRQSVSEVFSGIRRSFSRQSGRL